jgi:hypothetical protein
MQRLHVSPQLAHIVRKLLDAAALCAACMHMVHEQLLRICALLAGFLYTSGACLLAVSRATINMPAILV